MAIPEGYEKLAVIGIAYKGAYKLDTAYKLLNAVYYDGSTFVALRDNPVGTPSADGTNWQYLAKGFVEGVLSAMNATDSAGLLGGAGGTVDAQDLLDVIADRVVNKLLPTSSLVNNGTTTREGLALDARYGKTLADQVNQLNRDVSKKEVSFVPNTDYVSANYCRIAGKVGMYKFKVYIECNNLPQNYEKITIGRISTTFQTDVVVSISNGMTLYVDEDGTVKINTAGAGGKLTILENLLLF